jgi:4'-phosphopantetheinyl transferase
LCQVDVWRVRVDEHSHALADHWQLLDANERQRASGYRREADRIRYVISRGTLRGLVGRQLQVEPARVAFGIGEFGKPFVAEHHGLHFNSSHSGDWVLHALSTAAPVGVDVEALLPGRIDLEDFSHALAPRELERLLSLPVAHRNAAFADIWVCKESYVKAIGQGLNRALADICVGPLEAGGYGLLFDRNPGGAGGVWSFAMLDLGPAYAGCLAHPGPPLLVRVLDYEGDPAGGR